VASSRFQKGKSGNPGGRPKVAAILGRIREQPDHIRDEMFRMALKVVRAGPKSTNDASWRYAFDWVAAHLGLKPKETIVHEFSDGGGEDGRDITDYTDDELDAIIAAADQALTTAPDEGAPGDSSPAN
jgi:hypothetical protein